VITWTTGTTVALCALALFALAVLVRRALDRAERQHRQINAEELDPHPEGDDTT
jgi:uncharacterized protein (TIGR03382 family)